MLRILTYIMHRYRICTTQYVLKLPEQNSCKYLKDLLEIEEQIFLTIFKIFGNLSTIKNLAIKFKGNFKN